MFNNRAVLHAFVAAGVGRLSFSTIGLALLLATEQATGSFAVAGLALGVFGVASVAAPVKARLIDRLGARRMLPLLAAGYAAALLLTCYFDGLHVPAAAVAGLTAPPLGSTMRAVWAQLLPDPADRQRAYSLDAVVEEVLFAAGPLLVGVIVLWSTPDTALVLCAGLMVVGTGTLVTSSAVPKPVTVKRDSHWAGPLRGRGFRVLVAVEFAVGLGCGPVEVAVAAKAEVAGQPAAAGYLLAAMAVGSAIGGLVWGRVKHGRRTSVILALLLTVLTTSVTVASFVPSLPALGVVLAALGLASAPALVVAWLAADELAPETARLEANAWVTTAANLGVSFGAMLAGLVIQHSTAGLSLAGGAGVLALTTLAVAVSGRSLDRVIKPVS
ncbi:MFS transporter [Streptosporangium pseudovulgare]|uniref:MFS transporter n=1 Tax=Streptosporangium pseudovulgare TaxID=35765 RepID=A0ABQ2RB73_9ACTN|nr:MFS transporter [Streptosporangium pseudovulgare]GGQ23064.1 MFS transporter [Streptosporangium pseudovulgare]